MVNEKGHLYQISNLNSNPMDVRRIATSKELTAKSESFAMTFMTLADEVVIILAWADSSKSMGYIKKIPMRFDVSCMIPSAVQDCSNHEKGDAGIPQTPSIMHSSITLAQTHAELEGEANQIKKPPVELTAPVEAVTESPNTIDNLMEDIKGKLNRDYT